MKVDTKVLEDRQATLTVEVEPERVERAMQVAARSLARRVSIPGFRKGKAPYHIILQQFGEEALFEEAIDTLGQEVYKEALQQSTLEPYGPSSLNDIRRRPVVLTFTVPLRPEVDLKDYRKVRVKREKVKVTKEEVEDALEALREDQAVLEPVSRGIERGDVATLDLKGTILLEEGAEPDTLVERRGAAILIEKDTTYPLPGFADHVLGMQAGEERSFSLTTSDDFSDDETLAGNEVHFTVKCIEVRRRDLPDLDDELARSVGDFEDLKALRAHVEEDLGQHKQLHADEEYANEALEGMVKKASISYPPVMLEEWIDDMVADFERALKRQQNLTLQDYYSIAETNQEAMREDFREDAANNLQHALVMGKLVEVERLDVAGDEIEDQLKTMLLSAGQQAALARHFLESEGTKNEVRNRLLTQKVRERIIAIASGEAPKLDELEKEAKTEAGAD